ncbi:Outer membrane protein B precursor [compost metagenome]
MKSSLPQRTVLSLAISAALSAMVPMVALGQTVISVDTSATQYWTDNDFTVNSGVTLTSSPGDGAIYVSSSGVLGTLTNNGTINGGYSGVFNSGDISQLQNNGTIQGGDSYGVSNSQGSSIGLFNNNGSISGTSGGILNGGAIGDFVNGEDGSVTSMENASTGTIAHLINLGTISKLENSGQIVAPGPSEASLINTGTITLLDNQSGGTIQRLFNAGTITTLNNVGTLTGQFGLMNGGITTFATTTFSGRGNIGRLSNSGSIIGTGDAGIANLNGIITTLDNSGTISSVTTQGIFNNSGSEITTLNNAADGVISGVFAGIVNWGQITSLNNAGDIHGGIGISNDDVGATIGSLSNTGSISGNRAAVFNLGTINAINNELHGTLTGMSGIQNKGLITALTNSGKISASVPPVMMPSMGIMNEGRITTLTNNQSGVIADGLVGIGNFAAAQITLLSNAGTISAGNIAIYNFGGTITTLSNSGSIIGDDYGIANAEGQLNTGGSATVPVNAQIGTLTNSGTIKGDASGIYNAANNQITTLNNSGTILSVRDSAIENDGLITALNNKVGGLIKNGIFNTENGEISSLDNKGTIAGADSGASAYAIYNDGFINAINNSGLIKSSVAAIYLDTNGGMGTITNSGTIAGAIINQATQPLFINGGTGSVFGVLTGASGGTGTGDIGQITNQNSPLLFGSGKQLLNDHIDVGGSGNYVGNVGGVLQVNNHINITGDYRQTIAATLNIGAASGATSNGLSADLGYGRLIVSGNAVIEAGSSVMLQRVGGYRFANGQRYLVVQANSNGTNYNANSLLYGASGFNGTVSGSSITDGSNQSLLLTLDGGTENLATNNNAQSTLDGLFNYSGTDAGLMNLFNAAAAASSSDEGNRVGSQLNPASGKNSVAGASNSVGQQVNNIAFNRLDSDTSVPAQGGSGLSGGDAATDVAVWGQAFGGKASADARDGVSGYHASYAGLLFGADTALNDQWRAGGLFNYASTSVSNDGNNAGSYARVNSYGLTAYAGYKADAWYLNMSLGGMRSDVKAHRVIDITGFNGVANSSYKGSQYIAALQAGYPLNLDHVLPGAVLTPLAGLTYSSLRQDGYTETGGNGAALSVGSSDTHSVKSDLGVKLERAYKTEQGVLKPSVQLLWRHEYSDTRLQSVANFAADTSGATSFITQGAKPVKDTGVLSLGATLLRSNNLSLAVNYTLEQGGGYTSQTGSLLARWRY